MRLIRYIGLTRTGLTTKMVSKISRAVASIPVQYYPAVHMLPQRLEIQKVDCTAIAFLFSTRMKIDMELSSRCSLTLRRCKNCSLLAVRRVSNWSRLLGASSTFLRPNESTRIRGVCCARRRAGPPHRCSARNHGCGARNHRSAARMRRAQPSVPLEHQHENSSTSLRPSRAHAAAGGLSESRLISYTFRGVSCNISSFHWYIPGICLSYVTYHIMNRPNSNWTSILTNS